MTALLIVAAVLALLLLLPVGAHVAYDERGFTVRAILGILEFQVVPDPRQGREKPEGRPPRQKKKEKRKRRKKQAGKTEKPLGVKVQDFLPLLKLGIRAVYDLRNLFVIRRLVLRVTYGGEDAAATAMNYGVAWGVCGTAASLVQSAFRIRRCEIEPVLDYDCREIRIRADAGVTLTLGRLLAYLIRYGVQAMEILRKQKKEKAVQHESSSS